MASTFTAFLKFNKPALGDAGWGTAVNGGFTDLVDQAITGFIEKAVVAGANSLGSIASGASSDARNQFILLTGTLASPATLTVPAGTASPGNNKLYFIKNTAGDDVTITNGGASTVVVPDGKSMMLRSTSDGVEEAMTHQFSLSLGTALAATSGGTGQSSYAVGDLLYAGTTTTLVKLAAVATGSVLRAKGVGTAPAWEQVVLTTDVTGVLPVANGGTGVATLSQNQVLLGNGTSPPQGIAAGADGEVLTASSGTWVSAALVSGPNAAVLTASDPGWTIPAGVTKLKVTVVGGGGGGGTATAFAGNTVAGGAGGGGCTAIKWLSGLTPGQTLNVTIGAGGTPGNAGSQSSVASGTATITTISANGGGAGTTISSGGTIAGASGSGSSTSAGADITYGGNDGLAFTEASGTNAFSIGGSSAFGGGASKQSAGAGVNGKSYGGGASGGVVILANSTATGGTGSGGVVIFEW